MSAPPEPRASKGRGDAIALGTIAVVLVVIAALVGLGGDFPLNDDWAYAWSARHLAETGEMRIVDWAAPSLVSHIAWGAAVVRLFGPSFVALRVGTLCFACVAGWLVYALARRGGLEVGRALVAALLLTVSPWWVCVAFSYMTEVPWLAAMLGAMLCLARARHGNLALLAAAGTLVGIAALSRQFAVFALPPFVLLVIRDARMERGERFVVDALKRSFAVGLPATALFIAFELWYVFIHGPTTANRETLVRGIDELSLSLRAVHGFASWHYLGLWVAPLAPAWLWQERRRRHAIIPIAISLAAAAGFAVWARVFLPLGTPASRRHGAMPFLGNTVGSFGVGPQTLTTVYRGFSPAIHSLNHLGIALTILSSIGAAVVGVAVFRALVSCARDLRSAIRRSTTDPSLGDDDDAMRVRWILLGFGALYLAWQIGTAPTLFDRYLIPLLPVVSFLVLEAVPMRVERSPFVVAGLLASAAVSVLGVHEYLSWNQARFDAVHKLEESGVAPEKIDAGFELNAARCFLPPGARHCEIHGTAWDEGARYRLAFAPVVSKRFGTCNDVDKVPYDRVGGDGAVYILDCGVAAPPEK